MGCFSAPKTTITPTSTLTPYQQELVTDIGGYLQPMIGQGMMPYGGQRVAGASPLQQGAFGMGMSLPAATSHYQGLATSAVGQATAPLNFQSTYDWTKRLWDRDIMPSVMERQAAMDGAGSGGTVDRLARAGEDLSLGMAAQMAPMELQGRQLQLAGAGQYGQIAGMGTEAAGTMANLGTMQRGIGQEQLSGDMQKWLESQPYNSPVWKLLQSILPYGQPQMENIAQTQAGGLGYSMLGGAAGSLGGAAGGALAGAALPGMSMGTGAALGLLGMI